MYPMRYKKIHQCRKIDRQKNVLLLSTSILSTSIVKTTVLSAVMGCPVIHLTLR